MRKVGIDTSEYMLPVIDVNAKISVQPKIKEIKDIYEKR